MAELTCWRECTAAARKAGREDARLDEIHWLLEELRVLLFAQTFGTAGPVSVKRIEARWLEQGLQVAHRCHVAAHRLGEVGHPKTLIEKIAEALAATFELKVEP